MNFKSKNTSLLILGVTSLLCSRATFFFVNDPEGPNLLIVIVLAVIAYLLSLTVYVYLPLTKQEGFKKLLAPILIQILLVAGFYFGLN